MDVQALLATLDPSQADEHPALPAEATTASGFKTPMANPPWSTSSASRGNDLWASPRKEGWRSGASRVNPAEDSNGENSATSKDDTFVVLGDPPTSGIPTVEDLGSPPAYRDVVANENASSPPFAQNENVGDEGASNGSSDDGRDGAAAINAALAEENARLRSELSTFDLGFFEEVEDLKYSYASLKREAEKLAANNRQRKKLEGGLHSEQAPAGSPGLDHLELPEEGQEPWDRSVDMAHHSVDWAASMARSNRGRSPPRGEHAARLAKQWESLSSSAAPPEGPGTQGFPVGSASPLRSRSGAGVTDSNAFGATDEGWVARSPGRRKGGAFLAAAAAATATAPVSRASNSAKNGMLVAAHERKLAWELSCGGMSSLACLREHLRWATRGDEDGRPDSTSDGGDCFGSDEEVLSALRCSGYDSLELEDVAVLRSGLGSSADGRVDLKEFTGMCEDIASGHEWYVPPTSGVWAPAVAGGRVTTAPPERFTKNDSAAAVDNGDTVGGVPSQLPASLFLDNGGWEWPPPDDGMGKHIGGEGRKWGGEGRGTGEGRASSAPHRLYDGTGGVPGVSALGDGVPLSPAVPRDSLFMGGTVFGEKSFLESSKITAEDALAELKDQLSLLDPDHLFPPSVYAAAGGTGGPVPGANAGPAAVPVAAAQGGTVAGAAGSGGVGKTLGQAIGAKFSRRDPAQSGLLSAREVGLALEDIGVTLKADEVVALVGKFKPPGGKPPRGQNGDGSSTTRSKASGRDAPASAPRPWQNRNGNGGAVAVGELDSAVAEYAPLVRVVVDCLAEAAGIDPAVGGRARLGQRALKWNERMPAPAKRLRAVLAAGEGGVGVKRLRRRLASFLVAPGFSVWWRDVCVGRGGGGRCGYFVDRVLTASLSV